MAQLRPEVRPLVSSMPVDGFGMQTGGSARRRVVPFDTAMNSYKVTGVPGHTHNASAVCSVLVDNTERSNAEFRIGDHFAAAQVVVAAPRFTDSAEVSESDYDRALERGIGEIAIVPENCHQEIREPARAISEVRSLVMPKDKRDTLTYVEEVGGFVDQETGRTAVPEPAYPDIMVDLFHAYELPVANVTAVAGGDFRTGTGNLAFAEGELRFEGYHPTTDPGWSRTQVARVGSSLVPLRAVGGTLATVDGKSWEGVVTLQWDPVNKSYFCPAFEAIFTTMYETGPAGNHTHANFEVQFPEIRTPVSRDGQCVFAGGERPLRDEPAANEGFATLSCSVDQNILQGPVRGGNVVFKVWPFRIATGYASAIRGPSRGVNYWTRVLNTRLMESARNVSELGASDEAARILMFTNAANAKTSNRMLQTGMRTFFSTRANTWNTTSNLPVFNNRNAFEGTSYDMCPTNINLNGRGFGPVFGLTAAGNLHNPDVNSAANYRGFALLPVAAQALYNAGGHANENPANWNPLAYAYNNQRVTRRLDVAKLLYNTNFASAEDVVRHIATEGSLAFDNTRKVTIRIPRIDDATGITEVNPNGDEVADIVLYQSRDHYTRLETNLTNTVTFKNTQVRTKNQNLVHHKANETTARDGVFPTQAVGGDAPEILYGVAPPGPGASDNEIAAACQQVLPPIRQAVQRAINELNAAKLALTTASAKLENHQSGQGMFYGTKPRLNAAQPPTEPTSELLVLDDTHLALDLTVDNAAAFATEGPFACALPCTLRYLFEDKKMALHVTGAIAAAPQNATFEEIFWATRNVGLAPEAADDDGTLHGDRQQQESAPFVTFCEPKARVVGDANTRIHINVDCTSLFDMTSIFQDFPDVAADWRNDAGDGFNQQPVVTRRDTAVGKEIIVLSVGMMDNLQQTSQMGQHERSVRTKFDVLTLNADTGSTCIVRVAHTNAAQIQNAGHAVRPIMQALGNKDDAQPLRRDSMSVMEHRVSGSQPVILTPSYIAQHNGLAASNNLIIADNMLYIGNAHLAFDSNRYVFLIMNDHGAPNTGTIDLANPEHPTVLVFETQDCEPVLHFDEYFNFANVLTRVRNVRVREGNALVPLTAAILTTIMHDDSMGTGLTAEEREGNRSFCTMYFPSFKFQDTFWNADPFASLASDSQRTGVVHRSQLRVSQHLCAPLLNPNGRIGCSAPLNYGSLHLPPELRDFRIELRDVDFSFLPGSSNATLEALTLYEFNGGNQLAGAQPSMLYMPHFRHFQVTTTTQAFEMEIFSPYGNPSYIAMYARSKVRPNEYVKQPLIKTLSIQSGTTMKKSNTILQAREHELFHLTQRNVHPRAEYTRVTNQQRQVVLLCAEDIGDMGIAQYQKEKRSVFLLSGDLDVPATVTALFIYNNRGLSIQNLEIGVVRV